MSFKVEELKGQLRLLEDDQEVTLGQDQESCDILTRACPSIQPIPSGEYYHNRDKFLAAMREIGSERKRDGAFAWGVFEELAEEGRYTETFLIESWLELMYLYERVTNADRRMEERVRQLLTEPPKITHLVAPKRGRHFERVMPAA